MAALAKALGIAQSTLTNIQSASRSASPELIKKIERLAPGIEDGSILGAQAMSGNNKNDVEQPSNIGERLKGAHRERLQELQSSEEKISKNIREVARNFDSMGSDDVFIFVSAIERPFEMDPNDVALRPAILEAVRRRSFFIYLRPTRQYLKHLNYFVDIDLEFENFKSTLFFSLSKEERTAYAGHLVLIRSDHVPLFVLPDVKWDIFYSDRIDAPQKALVGALFAAGTDFTSGTHIRIPLSVDSSKSVFFEVVKAICQASSGRRGHGKVPKTLITRLKKSAEEATTRIIRGRE
jgi:hypothetical protein